MGVGPGLPAYKLSTSLPQDTPSLSTSLVTICAAQRSIAVRGHQGTVPQRLPCHTTRGDTSEMKIMGSRRILSTTRYAHGRSHSASFSMLPRSKASQPSCRTCPESSLKA